LASSSFSARALTDLSTFPSSNIQERHLLHPLSDQFFFSLLKMGLFDSLTELLEAVAPWSQAEAEAPKDEVRRGFSDSVAGWRLR